MGTRAEIHVKGCNRLTYVKHDGDPSNILPSLQALNLVGGPDEVHEAILLEGGPLVDSAPADGRYGAILDYVYIVDPGAGEISVYRRPEKYWLDIAEKREQPYAASLSGFELIEVVSRIGLGKEEGDRGSGRDWSDIILRLAIGSSIAGVAIALLSGCFPANAEPASAPLPPASATYEPASAPLEVQSEHVTQDRIDLNRRRWFRDAEEAQREREEMPETIRQQQAGQTSQTGFY